MSSSCYLASNHKLPQGALRPDNNTNTWTIRAYEQALNDSGKETGSRQQKEAQGGPSFETDKSPTGVHRSVVDFAMAASAVCTRSLGTFNSGCKYILKTDWWPVPKPQKTDPFSIINVTSWMHFTFAFGCSGCVQQVRMDQNIDGKKLQTSSQSAPPAKSPHSLLICIHSVFQAVGI